MILKITLLILFSFASSKKLRLGVGRPPERADHILCKVQMYERLEKINEDNDPRAIAEAYYNRTGYACRTYCRVRSAHRELAKITLEFDSPYYVLCAGDRYCSKGGRCKRFSSPLKLDDKSDETQNDTTVTDSDLMTTNSIKTTATTKISSTHSVIAVTTTPGTTTTQLATTQYLPTTIQHATTAQSTAMPHPTTMVHASTTSQSTTMSHFTTISQPSSTLTTTAHHSSSVSPTKARNTTPIPVITRSIATNRKPKTTDKLVANGNEENEEFPSTESLATDIKPE